MVSGKSLVGLFVASSLQPCSSPVGWTAVVDSTPGLRAGAGLALCYDILYLASLRADLSCSLFPDDPSDCLLAKETSCL